MYMKQQLNKRTDSVKFRERTRRRIEGRKGREMVSGLQLYIHIYVNIYEKAVQTILKFHWINSIILTISKYQTLWLHIINAYSINLDTFVEIFSSGTRRAPVNTTKPSVVFITAFLILNSALRVSMGTTATAFQERSPQITSNEAYCFSLF